MSHVIEWDGVLDGGGGGEGGGGEEDGILNVCRGGRPSGKASLSGGIQMTVLQSLKKSLSRLTEILVFVLLIRQHRRLPIHESETSRLVYFQYWPTINWDSVWTFSERWSKLWCFVARLEKQDAKVLFTIFCIFKKMFQVAVSNHMFSDEVNYVSLHVSCKPSQTKIIEAIHFNI